MGSGSGSALERERGDVRASESPGEVVLARIDYEHSEHYSDPQQFRVVTRDQSGTVDHHQIDVPWCMSDFTDPAYELMLSLAGCGYTGLHIIERFIEGIERTPEQEI